MDAGGGDAGGGDAGGGDAAALHSPCTVTMNHPSTLCSGVTCPVVADADVRCGHQSDFEVGVGNAGEGYLFVNDNEPPPFDSPQLFAINASGARPLDIAAVTAVRDAFDPNCGPAAPAPSGCERAPTRFVTDADGAPHFLQFEVLHRGMSWASLGAGGWSFETAGGPADGVGVLGVNAFAAGSGGHVAVIASPVGSGGAAQLLSRDGATGTWSSTALAMNGAPFWDPNTAKAAAAIDASGHPSVAVIQSRSTSVSASVFSDLYVGPPGAVQDVASTNVSPIGLGLAWMVTAATMPAGAPGPTVVANLPDALHVYTAQSASTYADVAIPDTPLLTTKGCTGSCSGPCTEKGDGATAFALTSTGDGATWLAWRHVSVDRDITWSTTPSHGPSCNKVVAADRSTSEILLAKLTPSGTPDVRLHIPFPADVQSVGEIELARLRLAGRGSRLLVGILTGQLQQLQPGSFSLRYLDLDATKL